MNSTLDRCAVPGDRFVEGRYEWEVLTAPAYPTIGGSRKFVWVRAVKVLTEKPLPKQADQIRMVW